MALHQILAIGAEEREGKGIGSYHILAAGLVSLGFLGGLSLTVFLVLFKIGFLPFQCSRCQCSRYPFPAPIEPISLSPNLPSTPPLLTFFQCVVKASVSSALRVIVQRLQLSDK